MFFIQLELFENNRKRDQEWLKYKKITLNECLVYHNNPLGWHGLIIKNDLVKIYLLTAIYSGIKRILAAKCKCRRYQASR